MSEKMRIAIVGAGAVGLYLAWKLSECGHRVTVFEKRKTIEAKACSALVSERIYSFVPGIADLVENDIYRCRIYFPRKTVTLRFEPPFLCMPRQKLNERLAQYALSAGATICFNSPMQQVERLQEDYQRIIACDGSKSRIRKSLGLPDPAFRRGIQLFVQDKDYSGNVETWPVPEGFCWRIPRGGSVEYGILAGIANAAPLFHAFCEERGIERGKQKWKAALVPQGLVLPRGMPSVTLCGDAAGLTKPWSGGGIVWGFIAADFLIKHFPDFEAYRKEVTDFFSPKIKRGITAVCLVSWLSSHFPYILPSQKRYDNDFLTGREVRFAIERKQR